MTKHADRLEERLKQILHGPVSSAPVPASDPELEPLLAVAKDLHQIGAIAPSAGAVQRIRVALRRASVQPAQPVRIWWPKLVTALPVAVVLLVVTGTLTALAAPSALPDSPLYSVRNVRESVEIQLADTPGQRASLYVAFAQQRANQLREVTRANGASPTVVTTLLRDISSRVHAADAEAKDEGSGARAALEPAEAQIETELTQIQASGALPPDASQQLDTTIQDVQSSESTNAAEATPTPEGTSAPSDTSSPEPTAQPTASPESMTSPEPTPTGAPTPSAEASPSVDATTSAEPTITNPPTSGPQ